MQESIQKILFTEICSIQTQGTLLPMEYWMPAGCQTSPTTFLFSTVASEQFAV